jgi:catechol 2,3-dioxygenase-like lactoylglutathione lyase family enzyme
MGSKTTASVTIHISIDVPELEPGLAFYCGVFGLRERARPFPTMAVLDGNNVTICMHGKAAGTQSSAAGQELRHYERHWTPVHIDFHVSDFDAVVERAQAAGARVENEFRNGPKAVVFCSDPFGNGFCIIEDEVSPSDAAAAGVEA